MKKNSEWIPLIFAFGFFLSSRLVIIFGYNTYISDLNLFKVVADYGMKSGYVAYRDFWFPYPPLALPLIYIPSLLTESFEGFRKLFQLEMFMFDALTLYLMFLFLKDRMGCKPLKIAFATVLYSIMGLFVGHLIYDRFDMAIAATFMASVYFFTGAARWKTISFVVSFLGAIVKLVPLFWSFLFIIYESVTADGINFRKALKPVLIIFLAFTFFMIYYDSTVKHNLFKLMGEQGKRGIQIESVWGAPWMLYYSIAKIPASEKLNSEYAAQHINDSVLPKYYLIASKYAGFLMLGIFLAATALMKWKRRVSDKPEPWTFLLGMLFVLVLLISTQRVLSPQYMIWLMPGLATVSFGRRPDIPLIAISTAIFALSWLGFDLGYWKYVELDLKFVAIVNLRNLLLLFLCIILLGRIFKSENGKDGGHAADA